MNDLLFLLTFPIYLFVSRNEILSPCIILFIKLLSTEPNAPLVPFDIIELSIFRVIPVNVPFGNASVSFVDYFVS